MKCINCKEEKKFSIFGDHHDNTVINLSDLRGICFNCYQKVPSYIPRQQVKRWLFNNSEQLLRGGK